MFQRIVGRAALVFGLTVLSGCGDENRKVKPNASPPPLPNKIPENAGDKQSETQGKSFTAPKPPPQPKGFN